jgi:hypothetical protein
MIVLDTNVVSEMMKPAPFGAIGDWLASQESSSVFTAVITQAEILYSIEVLPAACASTVWLSLLGSFSTNFSLEGYFPSVRNLRGNIQEYLPAAGQLDLLSRSLMP